MKKIFHKLIRSELGTKYISAVQFDIIWFTPLFKIMTINVSMITPRLPACRLSYLLSDTHQPVIVLVGMIIMKRWDLLLAYCSLSGISFIKKMSMKIFVSAAAVAHIFPFSPPSGGSAAVEKIVTSSNFDQRCQR